MALRIKTLDANSIQNKPLFFDANVLLYLFGGVTYPKWAVDGYSRIFKQCLKADNTLYLDVIILSEFVNRFLRIEYDKYLKTNQPAQHDIKFKDFRSTIKGIEASEDIELIVKDTILRRFTMVGKLFNEADICNIDFKNTDFNDELIIQICKENQCVLVTNDADFSGADIDILTINNKLN